MSNCRIIDRLALTKGIVRVIGQQDSTQSQQLQQYGEICPECGQHTFFPEAGGWSCKSCGYSFCEVRW